MFKQMQDNLPEKVKRAQLFIMHLGDYSQMSEDDDITSNIKELSALFVAQGNILHHIMSCVCDMLIIYTPISIVLYCRRSG